MSKNFPKIGNKILNSHIEVPLIDQNYRKIKLDVPGVWFVPGLNPGSFVPENFPLHTNRLNVTTIVWNAIIGELAQVALVIVPYNIDIGSTRRKNNACRCRQNIDLLSFYCTARFWQWYEKFALYNTTKAPCPDSLFTCFSNWETGNY